MNWGILFLLGLIACTAPLLPQGPSTTPYQGSGTEQFFLPELPAWSNGNLSAGCARTLSVRFLDHSSLERVHGLNFSQRVELQTQFNRKWSERYAKSLVRAITPQEETVLFLETLEQVKGGLRELKYPPQGKLQLVWWDLIQSHAWAKTWLKTLADQGDPVVLMSFCTDAHGVEAWIEMQGLSDYGLFTLGTETMGPTGVDDQLRAGLVMPLEALVAKERVVFWTTGFYPAELPSGLNVKTVEEPHVRKKH